MRHDIIIYRIIVYYLLIPLDSLFIIKQINVTFVDPTMIDPKMEPNMMK